VHVPSTYALPAFPFRTPSIKKENKKNARTSVKPIKEDGAVYKTSPNVFSPEYVM